MAELELNLVSEEFVQEVRAALRNNKNGFTPQVVRPAPPAQQPDGIRVFNTSSTDTIRGYGIMAVVDSASGSIPDVLNVVTPSTTFYRTYLVNGPVQIQPSGWGFAQKGPIVRVAYDSGTPANGEGWGPKPSQDTISKNYPETCTIQGVYDSTNKIALARLGPISLVIGKPNAAIAKGASGTVNVWQGTAGSESVISSLQIASVYNRGQDVGTGDFVTVEWIDGLPYLRSASGCATNPAAVDTFGGTSEHSESADSSTWAACAGNGLELYAVTGEAYNEAGDEKLYSFVRKLTFDKTGKLYSVGAETRITIDTPDAC